MRYSAGGAEPVAAAWAAARDPGAMIWLLTWYDAGAFDAQTRVAWRRVNAALTAGTGAHVVTAETNAAYCAALRAAVPAPPTLAALLAELERRKEPEQQ